MKRAWFALCFCLVDLNHFVGIIQIAKNVEKSFKYGNVIRNVLPKNYKWPNKTIFYQISGAFVESELENIKQAISLIASVSCISFVERSNQVGYVDITSEESGCWADSGFQTTRSQLNLGPTCASTLGTPLHELMHVLGFLHQHTRPDRDQYVEVLYENAIQRPELLFNFEIIEPWTDTGFPLPYDYDSIMHYTPHMFSRDPGRLVTIRARNPRIMTFGQRDRLSELDVVAINLMYCVEENVCQ